MSKGRKRTSPQTEAWKGYWSGGPHPDSSRPGSANRVPAPFAGEEGETSLGRMDLRESFYCHHYRQEGEHYHKTFAELEGCER